MKTVQKLYHGYPRKVLNRSGVYRFTNKINKKSYVGSTTNLRKRKNLHFSKLRNNIAHNISLQGDFNTYGEENFEFKVLEFVDDHSLLFEKEQYWVESLGAEKIGYNSRENVEDNKGFLHSGISKIKISRAKSGTKLSESTKSKMSQSRKGRKLSDEHKKRLSESKIGNKNFLGKKHTQETKDKISSGRLGSSNPIAKLDEKKVKEIKKKIISGHSDSKLGQEYGVSRKCISKIRKGQTWSQVKI